MAPLNNDNLVSGQFSWQPKQSVQREVTVEAMESWALFVAQALTVLTKLSEWHTLSRVTDIANNTCHACHLMPACVQLIHQTDAFDRHFVRLADDLHTTLHVMTAMAIVSDRQ